MVNIYVNLIESQIEELIENVETMEYVTYMTMDDWNDYMAGTPATEIIDSINMDHFDTCDEYAVRDGLGTWVSADNLQEVLEPYLDEMLQEFIDNTLS